MKVDFVSGKDSIFSCRDLFRICVEDCNGCPIEGVLCGYNVSSKKFDKIVKNGSRLVDIKKSFLGVGKENCKELSLRGVKNEKIKIKVYIDDGENQKSVYAVDENGNGNEIIDLGVKKNNKKVEKEEKKGVEESKCIERIDLGKCIKGKIFIEYMGKNKYYENGAIKVKMDKEWKDMNKAGRIFVVDENGEFRNDVLKKWNGNEFVKSGMKISEIKKKVFGNAGEMCGSLSLKIARDDMKEEKLYVVIEYDNKLFDCEFKCF